jgi:hypothetical protein
MTIFMSTVITHATNGVPCVVEEVHSRFTRRWPYLQKFDVKNWKKPLQGDVSAVTKVDWFRSLSAAASTGEAGGF